MIVDCHSHIWKHPGELTDNLVNDLLSVGYHPDMLDITPDKHREALDYADVSIVFGLRAELSGFNIDNRTIADYVATEPDKLIGFAALDPTEENTLEELDRCVSDFGMKGLKMTPIYSGYHPADKRAMPVYEIAEKHGLPILFHQGATFPVKAPLKYANPVQLEEIALRHPDLKIIVAHLGHPWLEEAIVLIRKQPNVFADISGLFGRQWQAYNALRLSLEYGIIDKLLFGTDFPFFTYEETMGGLRKVVEFSQQSGVPPLPDDLPDRILHQDTLSLLGLDDPRKNPSS